MAKNKFPLSPQIRGYIEWQLEHYREDKRFLAQYKTELALVSAVSYSEAPSHGDAGSPTERAGIKLATSPYILATERSLGAIETVLARCDTADLALLEMVYFKHTHTVTGAGLCVGLSKTGAYDRINKLLYMIAAEMGLTGHG